MNIDDIAEKIRKAEASNAEDVAALFNLTIELYANQRIDNTETEKDGDMLLFEWGSYGQGTERRFTLDLTRQTILDLPDPDDAADSLRQLHVTALYPVSAETEQLGKGQKWCASPTALTEFIAFIKNSPAYQWAISSRLASLEISSESV